MTRLSTALSALQVSQRALDVIGNNIANANTPGYHRQVGRMANLRSSEFGGLSFGNGVDILEISRSRDYVLEKNVTRQISAAATIETRLIELRQQETRLSLEGNTPGERIDSLFNEFEQLSTRVEDRTTRTGVLNAAESLTTEFNSLAVDYHRKLESFNELIGNKLSEINSLTRRIADLNLNVQRLENRGINANDFRDQRDTLINDLAKLINVDTIEQGDGTTTVLSNGAPLAIGANSLELTMQIGEGNEVQILAGEAQPPVDVTGGELHGLLDLRNNSLLDLKTRLDSMARELALNFDRVQSTGVGTDGGFSLLTGQRAAKDINATLENAGLQFQPTAGNLYIGITDTTTPTPQRRIVTVAVDPTQQRLKSAAPPAADPTTSLVDAINFSASGAFPNSLSAFVNDQTGQLTIQAAAGFQFDFVGGIGTPSPTPSAVPVAPAVASQPTLGGTYTGSDNDTFTFEFLGGGTIGTTANLQVEVRDASNNVIATLDVGQGYEPGQALNVADGVTVAFSAGDVVANATFGSDVIADADTSDILVALGLNTFFQGNDAITLKLNSDLRGEPGRLATTQTGEAGDTSNVQRFVALRDQSLLNNGTQTFSAYYTSTVTSVALSVQELTDNHETQQLLGERLEAERQSVSGVDPNQELVEMIKFQRMFQLAAQFITTTNQTFDELMNIIR